MAIFGCRDGWVYCLRTTDGEQVWRYRAAPEERLIVSYEQLESAWPVNGAVLVQDGSVYGVAGRSMFLDGGLHLFKLDALTSPDDVDSKRFHSRTELLKTLDDFHDGAGKSTPHVNLQQNYEKALRLLSSGPARRAFDLTTKGR